MFTINIGAGQMIGNRWESIKTMFHYKETSVASQFDISRAMGCVIIGESTLVPTDYPLQLLMTHCHSVCQEFWLTQYLHAPFY